MMKPESRNHPQPTGPDSIWPDFPIINPADQAFAPAELRSPGYRRVWPAVRLATLPAPLRGVTVSSSSLE